MKARINFKDDRYYIAQDGEDSMFWLSRQTLPGHIDTFEQILAQTQGKLWINVTTNRGRRYHRAVFPGPLEMPTSSRGISTDDSRYKDYALFHRWPMRN